MSRRTQTQDRCERFLSSSRCQTLTDSASQIVVNGGQNTFTYDHVYGTNSDQVCASFCVTGLIDSAEQESIYNTTVLPLVHACFTGYNGTVLAYGQTGSGKTHTMSGRNDSPTDELRGIIPRTIDTLFETVQQRSAQATFTIKLSYLEIHHDDIIDLLSPPEAGSPSSLGSEHVCFEHPHDL